MTLEFWKPSLLKPKPRRPAKPPKPRVYRPKLPVPAGKARQMLSSAIIHGDHELASWIDAAVKAGLVLPTPTPDDLDRLKERLDSVMVPLDDGQRSASPS